MHNTSDLSVTIVGAGFGGLCMAIMLKRAGIHDFEVLERAEDVGGVWRDNHYPGAACDVPAVLYSYSFEAEYPWSCGYPPQAEILDYIRFVVAKYELQPHLCFGQKVVEAGYDDAEAKWHVRTADGMTRVSDVFVSAVGIFNDPLVPRIPGSERFAGHAFHTARWRHDVELRGKNVAVIGTGASAIQVVPEMARVAARVTLYQRTAPFVMPKSVIEMRQPLAERERIFGEFEFIAGRRQDFAATAAAQEGFLRYLESQVPDAGLRARLTPNFTLGCKRSVFSNHWYTALQQPHVELVTDAMECLTARGIRARDGQEREADVLVYATGFNPANYLPGLRVHGSGDALLGEAWRDGAEAYLGMAVHGFPNMFLLFGPNTNVPGSVLYMLECQAHYVVQCLLGMRRRGARAMDISRHAMRAFCDGLQAEIQTSTQAAGQCQSYYMNEAGRVVTNFPGTQTRYHALTREVREDDYRFF